MVVYGFVIKRQLQQLYVITRPSPLPKILGRGERDRKQESAGKTTCGFLFSDYLPSNICR
jgi:hypothetical protein